MKLERLKNKLPTILLVVFTFLFTVPSITYLVQNKTIYKFYWVWTFLFKRPETQTEKFLNAGLFFLLFTSIFIIYFLIVKNNKKIFKNKKQIFILISFYFFSVFIVKTKKQRYIIISSLH